MKRILQVVSCLESGGTETFIINNYKNINRQELQFDFLVFVEGEHPYFDEIKSMGGRIFFCGTPLMSNINKFIERTSNIIKQNGPYAAVHSHVNIANSWVMLAAKRAGIPIRISHSHATTGMKYGGIKYVYRKFQLGILKKNATHFFACSKEAGEYLYGKTFFSKFGRVVRNGISVDKFINADRNETDSLRKQFNCQNQDMVVGNVTRFDSNKNQLFIIEIFKEILKYRPCAVLVLGGVDGGQLDAIVHKVKEFKIDKNVRFIGRRNDIPHCLKLIDVYLFPSLHEGLGIALLEAQASGCECVASTGVSKEADMGIGNITFISLEETPQYWAKKIVEIYDNREIPSAGKIKKCFATKGYLIEDTARKLVEVYESN